MDLDIWFWSSAYFIHRCYNETMLEAINDYLAYQGRKYIKPEKAGKQASQMQALRSLAQVARKEFSELSRELAGQVAPFEPERVSQWMNQAQVCRPHFWCYYRLPSDGLEDVALAIRLYGQKDDFGISVEVSFIERKKSAQTLTKQAKVLGLPLKEGMYYFVQKDGQSHRVEGSEVNRQDLKEALATGQVRKVLVKTDIPVEPSTSKSALVTQLVQAFDCLLPYYQITKS
mgnify:CR=1 FL=1